MANYVRRRSSDTRKQRQSVRRTRSTKNVNSVYGVANTRRRKVREQFRESARNRARGLNETSLKAMSRRNNQMRIPPSSVKMYNQLSAFPPDIPQPNIFDLGIVNPPADFGDAVFNVNVFGGAKSPLVRIALQGSGHSNNFTIISEDTKPPYTINGLYINFVPSGRR